MKKRWMLTGFCLSALLLGMGIGGCRKTPPSPEQARRQADFQNSPDVVLCDLETVKLEDADLPENMPYFVRDMQRNDKKTLLRGELDIEDKQFAILLPAGETQFGESMALYEKAAGKLPYWWGADELKSVHTINGKYYEFAVLDNRTKFAASPYAGPTGLLKVGKHNRRVETATFNGSVESERYAAAVGPVNEDGWSQPCTECEIPVGDYRPAIMNVNYDNLSISISFNYHRDAQGRERSDRPELYGFSVREDTPYVLDFSNDPVVVFQTPAPNENRFKVGDEINFAAVLVDPELDIMIRGLRDTAVDVEKEYTDAAGNKQTYTTQKSLDPAVTVTRADGEVVAEGVMPFG